MYNVKKIILFVVVLFLLGCLCLGCAKTETGTASGSQNLESWIGEYTFSESSPPDQNMFYNISITQEDGIYDAKISIDGFQTTQRLQAKVAGDANAIDLIFEKYLSDNVGEPYQKGDVLLTFKNENGAINTYWGKIQPMLESNLAAGEYFKLESANEQVDFEKALMQNSIGQFLTAIKNEDSNAFKKIVSTDGLSVIRNFVSGGYGTRGKDVRDTYIQDELPLDLQFPVANETPIDPIYMFGDILDIKPDAIEVRETEENQLASISEQTSTAGIIKMIASALAGQNSEELKPVIYQLDNGFLFSYAQYIDGMPLGAFAMFTKQDDGYYLKALFDLR